MRSRLCLAVLFLSTAPLGAATVTVTSTNDSGAGSLRQAILDANATVGVTDTIAFNIPGGGVHTILPLADLPAIADPLTIDGFTQPGSAPNTNGPGLPDNSIHAIEIDGTNTSATKGCLLVGAGSGGSTVRGLVLNRCPGDGIQLFNSGGGNTVRGNFIGTDPTGAAALGVGGSAVRLRSSSSVLTEDNDVIGGTAPADRNVLSGAASGPGVKFDTSFHVVQGNFIGTNAAGTAALANGGGILIDGPNNTIGGTTPGARNLISGNNGRGITISSGLGSPTVTANLVQGNFIGTDVTGTFAIPNNGAGIGAYGLANTVGGSAAGAGNLVSGNLQAGVEVGAGNGTTVLGNRIGTDATGALPLGNTLSGVAIQAAQVTVGDTTGGGNTVAFNAAGITVGGTGNTIRGNSIFSNTGLGLDLGSDGATPNDQGDTDAGANTLQNFPVLVSVGANSSQGGVQVVGILHSAPSTTYTLDFYSNDACLRFPQDFLEGRTWLASAPVTTDGLGEGAFSVTVPLGSPDERVSMTATNPAGDTSEFSQRLPFTITPVSSPPAGGTAVTIGGTDFEGGATVTIGGLPATDVVVSFNQITATSPALPAGSLNDVTVTNTEATQGTLEKGFVVDFLDVPPNQQFHSFVTTLVANGITAGVGGGLYGVTQDTLRQQMAVFLLKAKYGLCYTPPPCTVAAFTDVPCSSGFAPWINELVAEGITGGCGGGNYCPTSPVLRQQMAVLLLRTYEAPGYAPPACVTATFTDVPCSSNFAPWIYELVARNITAGCGGGNYCPTSTANRGQMATFVVKTFSLQ
jgi:hypothetical protein